MNHSIVEVIFKVHANLDVGEEVRVSGNVPALGCDDPSRAVALITTPTEFPWWRSSTVLHLPGVDDLRYRYCIFSGGKFSRWEGNGKLLRSLSNMPSARGSVKYTKDKFGKEQMEPQTPEMSPMKFYATESQRSNHAMRLMEWSRTSQADYSVNERDTVVVISYFLPVTLTKIKPGKWLANWDKENILSLQMSSRLIWIGSIRFANAPIPVEEEDAVSEALLALNCHAVFLNQSHHFQFYDIFCKQNLWPIMHCIADVYGPLNLNDIGAKAQQNLWFVYSTVHKLFRDKVLEVYQQSYLIWIHGFHLMLLPSFLRRRLPFAKIGYFFHTPFPSSEIWRTMSRREDLLRGILGADQVGFHLYEYARHFATNCQRVLGVQYDSNTSGRMRIGVDGRDVSITCIHVGVDLPRADEIFASGDFVTQMRTWKERFQNRIIVAGIDRLERLKGIPLKLMAIDEFMEEHPQWLGKIVFTMIGISAGERGQDYRQTQHDVKLLVRNINEKFAQRCSDSQELVYFEERHDRDIRLAQRLAFFAAADVLLMTATRDGLNRYPMEYSLARQRYGESSGMAAGIGLPSHDTVIISEFISSARVMRGAIVVNPWRTEEVKDGLLKALEMSDTERADRTRRNLEFSRRLTTSNWAREVLHDLKEIEKSADPNTSFAVGFGMQYKVMDLKTAFHPLNNKDVMRAYRAARYRLIVLDWGGTLVSGVDKTDKMHAYAIATGHAVREKPPDELRSILEDLTSDVRNYVFVVSGKEQPAVAQYFGDYKGLGLGAEHGFYYRWPRDEESTAGRTSNGRWHSIMDVGDQSWKETAKVIMDIFVQRTHGTYIEQKGNALIWQFSEADPEFGFMQSKELMEHLKQVLAPYPVEVLRGGAVSDGYIEVRHAGASKGLFLEHCLSALKSAGHDADFVLSIGDDSSDEPMFQRIAYGLSVNTLRAGSSFAVTVGKKPTAATSYLDDTSSVLELLTTLSKTIEREKRYFSSVDLASAANRGAADKLQAERLYQEQLFNLRSSGLPSPPDSMPATPAAVLRATSDGPVLRSASAGNLDIKENLPRKSITDPDGSLLVGMRQAAIDEKIAQHTGERTAEMLRNISYTHLSMAEYMQSVTSENQDDDDGIFF